jgi:hypothetical protein
VRQNTLALPLKSTRRDHPARPFSFRVAQTIHNVLAAGRAELRARDAPDACV